MPGVDAGSATGRPRHTGRARIDSNYAVYCGIEVSEGEYHAVGLTAAGKKIYDKALPNDEAKLRAVFGRLASHGSVLVVVDQPNTIGALPVTVPA